LDESKVVFNGNIRIYNGELMTEGSGVFEVPANHSAWIENLTSNADIDVLNDGRCYIRGTVTNNDSISLNSTGTTTYLWLDQPTATLNGTGEVVLGTDYRNRIYTSNYSYRLLHSSDHTIRGGGNIGYNNMLLTNHGMIEADSLGVTMTIDLRNDGGAENFNTGIMQATNGGILQINAQTINNDTGIIQALDGSTVVLANGSHIYNGTLMAEGSGVFEVPSNHYTWIEDVTSDVDINVLNQGNCNIRGTVTNNGSINLNSTGSATYLYLDQPAATLDGTGEVVLGDHLNNRIHGSAWSNILTNGSAHTIRGGGNIGVNAIGIVNLGSIIADAPGGMTIDPSLSGFDNEGFIHVTGDGYLDINPGPVDHHGTVLIDATRTLHCDDDFTQTGGVTTVAGTLQVAGVVDLQGGVLEGSGIVEVSINNTGGSVSPGMSTGELSVVGDYSQNISGEYHVELGGTNPGEFDLLAVDGNANIAGTLRIDKINAFEPQVGDSFIVLTTTGIVTGMFDIVEPCEQYQINYDVDSVTILVVGSICHADTNCDGVVNADDFFALLGNWGECPSAPAACPWDITPLGGDGVVNADDFFFILGNWGPCE